MEPAALASTEAAWRELESAVQHRTHVSTFDFLFSWYRHYAGRYGGTPVVGLAWEGRTLVGVAPLTIRHGTIGRIPVTRVEFAPNDSIAGEFLIRDDRPEIAAWLLEDLKHHVAFDVIVLNGFDPASAQLDSLRTAAGAHGLSVELEDHACALVDLREGYDAYHRQLPGDIRRKLNHRARKIEALGADVDGVLPISDASVAERCLARMIAVIEASYKLEGRRLADHHRRFLRELVTRLAARGTLSLPILTVGGRDAAFILGVLERGCFYDVTLSYDESFAKLGPGIYLMQETLKQLAQAGIHTLVSHGAHEYKRQWSTTFVPQKRIYLFAPRPLAMTTRWIRFHLRPLLARIPSYARLNHSPHLTRA